MIATWLLVFVVSLVALVTAAGRFTTVSERVGTTLRIPQFIVGVLLVAVGTSLPELLTSLMAVIRTDAAAETTQVVIGNAMGSNIANILLIVGILTLVAGRVEVRRSLIELDLPILMIATTLLAFVSLDGAVTVVEAVVLLVGYSIYLRYSLSQRERTQLGADKRTAPQQPWWRRLFAWRGPSIGRDAGELVLLAIVLYFAAHYTVTSITELSVLLSVATSVIAVSAVAISTSLPEVAVSLHAVRRGNHDLAIGNIIGSNVFNAFVVVGLPALIRTIVVPGDILRLTLPVFVASALLFTISGISRRLYSFEGGLYLLFYGLFLAKLFRLI